jgi:hypothetical protein
VLENENTSTPADEQGAWARPVSARLGELIMALALLATAAFFMWQSALLDFGRVGLPGPGFFPFFLGVALAGLAVAILYHVWQDVDSAATVFLGHRDVLITLAALAGVAFAFERSDAYVAMGVFSAVLLIVVGRAALWRAALGTVLGMIGVWLFFGIALGVRLPTADFWDTIGALLPFGQP